MEKEEGACWCAAAAPAAAALEAVKPAFLGMTGCTESSSMLLH